MTVTVDNVKAIYPTTLDVAPFLDVAQKYVNSLALSSKGLSADLVDPVVLYFTAHLLVLTAEQGGLRRRRLGDGDESYKTPGDFDIGLRSTRFGQQAMILDSTGTLAAKTSGSGLKALFTVVGDGNAAGSTFENWWFT